MKIDFSGDPAIVAAVREGVRDALLDPRFGRELLRSLAGEFVYVTLQEAMGIVGHDERTVRRWATRNKVAWSRAFGDRQKRYQLGSLQRAMQGKEVRAAVPRLKGPKAPAPAPPAPPPPVPAPAPLNGRSHPAAPAGLPVRGVRIVRPDPRRAEETTLF